jgi:hypothetical protein
MVVVVDNVMGGDGGWWMDSAHAGGQLNMFSMKHNPGLEPMGAASLN